jgi:hypothetical protein
MRPDLLIKRIDQRSVFTRTVRRPRRRQKTFQIREFRPVGTKRQAQQIVEAFLRQTMITGKGGQSRLHHRVPLVVSQIRPPGPGSAADQSPRLPSAKLQHEVGRKIISGVLLAAEYRHIENIERCVCDLVQSRMEELPNGCIGGRDSGRWCRLAGNPVCASKARNRSSRLA